MKFPDERDADDAIYEQQCTTIANLRVDVLKLRAERDALVGQRDAALDQFEAQHRTVEQLAGTANRWRKVATGLATRLRCFDAGYLGLDEANRRALSAYDALNKETT